jgi:hypothetical protein
LSNSIHQKRGELQPIPRLEIGTGKIEANP